MYSLIYKSGTGVICEEIKMRKRKLLTTALNTKKIMDEAELFFTQKSVYDFLEKSMKRGILLYSAPGMGKTSAISQVCYDLIKEDPGTVVLNWPTSETDATDVSRFFSSRSFYSKECTRLVMIIEDIGGGESENNGGARGVDSDLLNILDGTDITFELPTFIMATTNYPQNLLDALADRPERFDEFIELDPPNQEERVLLTEFMAKRELTGEEKESLMLAKGFSIAHLGEIVARSLLKNKSYKEVIAEINGHKKRFSRGFEKNTNNLGLS